MLVVCDRRNKRKPQEYIGDFQQGSSRGEGEKKRKKRRLSQHQREMEKISRKGAKKYF
jgi:hypothetical protein